MFLPMFFEAKYLQEPSTKRRENGHRYLSLTKKPFSVDPFAKKKKCTLSMDSLTTFN